MHQERSLARQSDLIHFLDHAEVLTSTVAQLRKDLSLEPDAFPEPPLDRSTFEKLREQVLPKLQQLQEVSVHSLQVAMYRVDIPEAHFRRTLRTGGLEYLAGEVVLRAVQKVLTRMRAAGRF